MYKKCDFYFSLKASMEQSMHVDVQLTILYREGVIVTYKQIGFATWSSMFLHYITTNTLLRVHLGIHFTKYSY